MPNQWVYFTDNEVKNLDLEFVAMLERARHISKVPYIITSGFRTPEHNFAVGGESDSAHIKGLAVDLRVTGNRTLGLILKGLYQAGFNRIGIYYVYDKKDQPYPTHIHVDYDKTKDPDVCWIKKENT